MTPRGTVSGTLLIRIHYGGLQDGEQSPQHAETTTSWLAACHDLIPASPAPKYVSPQTRDVNGAQRDRTAQAHRAGSALGSEPRQVTPQGTFQRTC